MKTAKEIFAGFYAEESKLASGATTDTSSLLAWVSPEIVISQTSDLPWAGEWVGHDGFVEWFTGMGERFSGLSAADPQVFVAEVASDGAKETVVVQSTLKAKIRGTEEEWVAPMVQIGEVDREKGQVTMIRPFFFGTQNLVAALKRAGHVSADWKPT